MRHLRIPNQNIKNLSASKVVTMLRNLEKLNHESRKCENTNKETNPIASTSKPNESESTSNSMELRTRSRLAKTKRKTKFPKPNHVKRLLHKCKTCKLTTKNRREMLKHLETHVGTPISCLKCKRTFNGKMSFSWHLLYYCQFKHKKLKYKCNQCQREFVSKVNLNCHMLGHKRNNCSYCDKVITRQKHLIKHLLEVHSIKLERRTYECEFCQKRYIKKYSLYSHIRQHIPDKFVCLECGHVSGTCEENDKHKNVHNLQKYFKCSKCGDRFSRRQQYLCHMKKHDEFKCVTCNVTFGSRAKVIKHKQQGHEVEGLNPRFLCPHCPIAFHQKSKLHLHLRKHQDDNQTVNCKYCKKSFKSPYAYYKHCITISHNKYSPELNTIVCETCGKYFTKKLTLKQHIYRVHNKTKTPLVCEHCNYKTFNSCNMTRHTALHYRETVELTCEHCGKNFDNLACLKGHIAYNHVMDKQFKCTLCEKSFKRNSELMRHQDSHSDNRPHVCGVCNKSYKRQTHLKRHEKSAHPITATTTSSTSLINADNFVDDSLGTDNYLLDKLINQQRTQQQQQQDQVYVQDNLLNFSDFHEMNALNIVDQLVNSFLPDKEITICNEDFYNTNELNQNGVGTSGQVNEGFVRKNSEHFF